MKKEQQKKQPAKKNKMVKPRETAKNVMKGLRPTQAKTLEERLREAIKDGNGITLEATQGSFTQASEGVRAEFDIRTDKQTLALEAIEKVQGYVKNTQKTKQTETPGAE